jgi:single-strand DNA-binding protein
MINKVTLIGNLGKDPEVRHLENGSAVASFSLATNENYKDKAGNWQTQTEWHNIVAWRALAERAERDLKRGSMVYIEGKLTNRKWQDKEGNDRYRSEVVAYSLRSLEKRERSDSNSLGSFPSAQDEPTSYIKTSTNNVSETSSAPVSKKAEDMPEDDLPF